MTLRTNGSYHPRIKNLKGEEERKGGREKGRGREEGRKGEGMKRGPER